MIATGLDLEPANPAWPDCPYRVRPVGPEELAQPLAANVLCAVGYGEPVCAAPADSRRVTIALPALHGGRAGELWESHLPVEADSTGAVGLAGNGEVMMIRLSLPEPELGATARAAEHLYAELLRSAEARGYPHLLRIWNFVGNINDGDGDDERYRQFCVGRHRALSARPQFEASLPAATAIGTAGGGLTVLALVGRHAGLQIENPRQLSAFRYPRVYGARSPSFARATLLPWADGAQLMVSGTASIIGHATAHAGDLQAQLVQTAANLETLISQPGLARRGFLPELYTLYLRHADDLPLLLPLLPRYLGGAPLQVLHGDICRRELLLEVEAIYRLPRTGGQ
ncbi:MAG: pteridine-dependent deoxygenase [Nevskia sp.]